MTLSKDAAIYFILLLISIFQSGIFFAQSTFTNPIISGSHPDPSICLVGDTYYMVNSTFEYFPGLPIHQSRDLVNWELIGYGLDRKSQVTDKVNLSDVQSDGGIHAPTIRFHDGLFYIITTNVYYHEAQKTTDFVNFIITAKDPSGPWSDPHVLEGAPGIDPDIFFDDDGKVWYVGTHTPENPNFQGEGEIWLQEIDLTNWRLTGDRFYLWRGACGGVWAEGPRMYKYDNRYYLMIAEGGTSFNHAVMIAVSDSITGPFISNERNPILSTRHLSYDNWVHSTGHADIFQAHDETWYAVALGIRGDVNRASNMGRETFLVPMRWEEEPFEWKSKKYKWPVIAPESGKILREEKLPFDETEQIDLNSFHDDFETEKLDLHWNFRRVPIVDFHEIHSTEGVLRIIGSEVPIENRKQTSFLGFRQKESDFKYSSYIKFNSPDTNSSGGLLLIQKDNNYLKYVIEKQSQGYSLILSTQRPGFPEKIQKTELQDFSEAIELQIISRNNEYVFRYKLPGTTSYKTAFKSSADIILSKGYTGAFLGLYCGKTKTANTSYLDVDWVDVEWFPRK